MNHATPSVGDPAAVARIRDNPLLAPVAAEILWKAGQAVDVADYLGGSLPILAGTVSADYLLLVSGKAGRWTLIGDAGSTQSMPVELLGEAADREQPASRAPWAAVPLATRQPAVEILAAHCKSPAQTGAASQILVALAPVFWDALGLVRRQTMGQQRIHRLEKVLELSKQWNRTREVEPLLVEAAEAATKLLAADRASIFLWDRGNHILVGRPALGVKEGELRIPDDRGVVGQVIQSGQPQRVDAASEPNVIDHRVDTQLGYRTRTLLCVPLLGRSGELFGAFELINKRSGVFSDDDEATLVELAALAAVALENAQDRQELLATNRQMAHEAADRIQLIGRSPSIEALRSIIKRVADTDLAVLVLGENGTGKEVVAQSIHYGSRRRDRPFVAVNCAAIPEGLAESHLFGHEKGAFTDAKEARAGKFELASGGTLFLDEIGDLSLGSQAKLLRVLEEKTLVRVGGSTPLHTDVRVIAATNQNLAEMVRQKRFREDLYFRLNVVTLELPPLLSRPQDIMLLAEHFLRDFSARARRPVPEFSAAARQRLENHPWPGNVRELRNLMERLAYLSSADRIEAEDLAFILSPRGESPLAADANQSLGDATAQFQMEHIRRAFRHAGGNMTEAAERLGLHRSNLYRKMRQLGMPLPTQ